MKLMRYNKRLALHLSSEPFITNQMFGDSALRSYLENMDVALSQVEFTDQQLKQLSTDLGNYDSRAVWQKYLIAEAGNTIHDLDHFSRPDVDILKEFGRQKSNDAWERFKQYLLEFRIRADLQSPFFRAEIMRSILNVYSQQEKPLFDLFRELDAQHDALKKQRKDELDAKSISTPPVHYRLNTIMRQSASWRCTQIALAAERFRLQHQRWPRTQDELIPQYLPAVLLDPFDDKPLRLIAVEDGLHIYSVVGSALDREFKDDGGDIQKTEEKYLTKDTGVKLWNPAHRRKPAKPLEKREEQE